MDIAKLRAALQEALAALDGPATTDAAAGSGTAKAPRTPVMVDNAVPPAWSDKIANQSQNDYLAVLGGKAYTGTPPLSANQALASWANRPEASDFDYQQIRDGQMRLAKRMPTNVAYGIAIPAMMRQVAAEIAADPKPTGFLPGE